jgi:hypothetical protein
MSNVSSSDNDTLLCSNMQYKNFDEPKPIQMLTVVNHVGHVVGVENAYSVIIMHRLSVQQVVSCEEKSVAK